MTEPLKPKVGDRISYRHSDMTDAVLIEATVTEIVYEDIADPYVFLDNDNWAWLNEIEAIL